ncbi:translation initiation factor eIF-2B subunit delta isoform X1 [Aplysia californica]|uniref:Translation initiation factor eIF2B subunit delta n=1 Tax=Aplysia californica TaxID=6500 RepID=A0ABM1W141_APLCA|nr:translation initiation factor eIF-2B subunit delta isoform X1 [Aplysia californica]XP_035828384.1 translation initiation factor eIF-2B subunit delta isoform X2 [Aplysia californica]XP_035828385.1 translation initiation factor eIF-2B subunit delta isoform X1 [Aplysia californica]
MADSGKVKAPDSGKKKNKSQKKRAESSGDGGATPTPSKENVPVTKPASPEGATAAASTGEKTPDVKPAQGAQGPKQGGQNPKKEGKQQKNQNKPEQGQKGKGEKAPPKPEAGEGEQKSKAQLKAERRAIQEAQRAAKATKTAESGGGAAAAGAQGQPSSAGAANAGKKENQGEKSKPGGAAVAVRRIPKKSSKTTEKMTEEQLWAKKEKNLLGKAYKMDHTIVRLGYQYFYHNIVGANARCLALLTTLKELIGKYKTPEEKELSRDLEKNYLTPCISYLNECRPISTSMGNAIKHLKLHINQIPSDMDDKTAIARLQEEIESFIHVNLVMAAKGVAEFAIAKIDDDDVILVYAASSLIAKVLKAAHDSGKRFRVIVVEGRPRTEGKSMLRFLVRCGIMCSYVYIGSASHAMSEATKVLLGAAAMFAIGDMHSRTGNSMIAALAKANNLPVLVCCETYKFTEKVQLQAGDSQMHARSKDLLHIGHRPPVITDHDAMGLRLLNQMYDVTQSRYITALVTELGMLPCTSVPVVLRRQEDLKLNA